jgi:hypothetical protein
MKKGSTAALRQVRNLSAQKLTIGLDLGDRSSRYCVLDETGAIVREQKLATTKKAIEQVFSIMPRCRIALETGTHSPWVSRLLETATLLLNRIEIAGRHAHAMVEAGDATSRHCT